MLLQIYIMLSHLCFYKFSKLLSSSYFLKIIESYISGRSSGVERNLAKVEVEGSNPFARSNLFFNKLTLMYIPADFV